MSTRPGRFRSARRHVTHPQVPPPMNLLTSDSFPGYRDWARDDTWSSYNDPTFITPENIHEFNFNGFARSEMVDLIYGIYEHMDPDPDFVDAIIASLPRCHLVEDTDANDELFSSNGGDDNNDYDVEWYFQPEEVFHNPGRSDRMSGALLPGVQAPTWPRNDRTVCSADILSQTMSMPFRVVGHSELAQMDWLFENPTTTLPQLGEHFLTTNWGLNKAVTLCQHIQMQGQQGHSYDRLMLGALALVSGEASQEIVRFYRVPYPEDITPYIDEGHQLHDKEYWDQMRAQGNVWM